MPNKILILGSEGFIGSHLVNFFIQKKFKVFGCDIRQNENEKDYKYFKLDINDYASHPLRNYQFDICINASGSADVQNSYFNPYIDFQSNSEDVYKYLDFIRQFNINCKFLQISSAAVYGNPKKLPISEDSHLQPISIYGWNKLLSENICTEFNGIYNIKTAIVRPFSVYGNQLKKQLLWDLCVKFKNSNLIELYGSGKESRDFIHVNDLCEAIWLIIKNSNFENDIYNIASGIEVSISDIAKIFVNKNWSENKKFIFNNKMRIGYPISWQADINKIKELGFEVCTSLEYGVKSYIEWFNKL